MDLTGTLSVPPEVIVSVAMFDFRLVVHVFDEGQDLLGFFGLLGLDLFQGLVELTDHFGRELIHRHLDPW